MVNRNVREERPLCAECGEELVVECVKDEETQEIIIRFFCDSVYEDIFTFQISTGLNDWDLEDLTEVGKKLRKNMTIELLKREHDPELDEEYDESEDEERPNLK